ncbi:hypothetical protein TNCV_1261681, partial [Trichonephila clavipes]
GPTVFQNPLPRLLCSEVLAIPSVSQTVERPPSSKDQGEPC